MSYSGNIRHFYDKATKDEIDEGRDWYWSVNRWARLQTEVILNKYKGLGEDIDKYTERLIGVLSAISPRMRWDVNKENALKLVTAIQEGVSISSLRLGILANITKGAWIWQTGEFDLLGNMKVYNFYRNIWTPDANDWVTVDTWAWRVATNQLDDTYNGLTPNQYDAMAQGYRQVAGEIGAIANQIQAITWTVARRVASEKVISIEDSD